jgi:hypothetical protein
MYVVDPDIFLKKEREKEKKKENSFPFAERSK